MTRSARLVASLLLVSAAPLFAEGPAHHPKAGRTAEASAPPAPEQVVPDPAAAPVPLELQPIPGNPQLVGLGLPAPSPELRDLVRRYGNGRDARLFDVTTDGAAILIGTRFGSTQQLHLVDHALGMRQQLSFGEEPVLDARFLPQDPNLVLFLQDVGGGEFYQLFRLDRRTQKTELLTDGKSRNQDLVISHEGKRVAWASTARNGQDTDVVVAEPQGLKAPRRLTELPGTWRPLDFSPGARALLVVQERSAQDADLWLVNVESGEKKRLSPEAPKASVVAARFSADGRSVFLVTDRYADVNELVRIDPARPEAAPRRLSSNIPWEVSGLAETHDPGAPAQVAITVNQDGYDSLYLVEPGTGQLRALALPPGVLGGLRFPIARSDLLFFTEETAHGPADVWLLDVRTRRTTRWTRSELGPIDASELVDPELVRYPSPGGGQISGFLFKPQAADEAHPAPVIVLWHGGPEAQSRPNYSATLQLLVGQLGLAVLLPNVRGSSGYGKAWLAADDGVKREEALKDIGATLDFIGSRPDLDAKRIGVQGGSYGGYMTLATAAFYPDRIKAALDVVGISSLPSFLQNTQGYRRDLRRAEYGDERDPSVLAVQQRISPLGAADRIQAALFVVQGHNDPRVPRSEAEQIVRAVRGKGGTVWYLEGLNEGHGFRKKENRDALLELSLRFWKEQLLGPAPGAR